MLRGHFVFKKNFKNERMEENIVIRKGNPLRSFYIANFIANKKGLTTA
jgi:hypothetical protein